MIFTAVARDSVRAMLFGCRRFSRALPANIVDRAPDDVRVGTLTLPTRTYVTRLADACQMMARRLRPQATVIAEPYRFMLASSRMAR